MKRVGGTDTVLTYFASPEEAEFMAVDHYALCPCGSGKKVKFCKCASSIDELEKVMKMVNGGQMVAGLDRINSVLKEHPDAAWALAIKGRLLIALNEYEAVAENADRFIRLQPANPLALSQKAASCVFKDSILEAANYLLQAMAESGQAVDSFMLEISNVLALSLLQKRNFLSARLFATLPLTTDSFEDNELPQRILMELNRSPNINMLLKSLPLPIARPENATWGERFDEAKSLLHSNQILLAESKYEGLNRQFPKEPAILSGMLTCAIWKSDQDLQASLLRQLSEAITDDPERSARLLAMSSLIAPVKGGFSIQTCNLMAELENAEEVTIALAANGRLKSLPVEALRGAAIESEGVPPRAGYYLMSTEKPEKDASITADNLPIMQGTVLVFGKQTDRPARMLVADVYIEDRAEVESILSSAVGTDLSFEVKDQHNAGVHFFLVPRVDPEMIAECGLDDDQIDSLLSEIAKTRIASAPLSAFGDKTAMDVVDDPTTLPARTALIRLLQGFATSLKGVANGVEALADQIHVPSLPPLTPKSDAELEEVAAFDLERVDVSDLDAEGLEYLLHRTFQINSGGVMRRAAERIVGMDSSSFEDPTLVLSAYMALINNADNPKAAVEQCEKAKAWCQANNVSDGQLLLTEIQVHLQAGDGPAFERTMQEVISKHSQNPEIMAQLQQMLVQLGLINPDGSPRQAGGPAPASPASPSPLAGPEAPLSQPAGSNAPQEASGESKSKLWLPGMD